MPDSGHHASRARRMVESAKDLTGWGIKA